MSNSVSKLLWLDLEMTGLEVETSVIIECAAIVTDLNFKVLDSYEAVVKQPQHHLDAMDEWNTTHHRQSGLTAKVPNGTPSDEVESHLISMVKKHWGKNERPILAGNSIIQDRLFIEKYWSGLSEFLHYRMMDVSSWKIIFAEKFGKRYQKQNSHRALDDIQESINELKYYLTFLKADEKAEA